MSEYKTVALVDEIPAGEGRSYIVGDKMIAVFFVDGKYTAIDDLCPHMGASLASGYVEDGAVTCPWHAWRFSTCNGLWLDNPRSKLRQRVYPVQVEGQEIRVSPEPVPETPAEPTAATPAG